jgi:hypothetical protein
VSSIQPQEAVTVVVVASIHERARNILDELVVVKIESKTSE